MKKIISILIALVISTLPLVTLALVAPSGTLATDIGAIVKPVFQVVVAISLIFILYAGYTFVTAGGSSEKIEAARNTIVYGIIGIVVAFLAWAIYTLFLVP